MGPTQQRTAVRRAPAIRSGASALQVGAPEAVPSRRENFTSIITALRWATTAGALLVLSTGEATQADGVAGAAILAYALWRTVWPVDVGRGVAAITGIVMEAAVVLPAVIATGHWDSPYVLGILTVVSLAGFSGGIPAALTTTALCVAAVAVPYHLDNGEASLRLTGQWTGEIAMVGLLTAYARRVSSKASEETSAFIDRLQQLSEANTLLLRLHQVATTVPMSLDLSETLESSTDQLRELFQPDVTVVLLRRDVGWTVARAAGVGLENFLSDEDLPTSLRDAATAAGPVLLSNLDGASTATLGHDSRSAVYAPLRARDELLGLLALEHRDPSGIDPTQLAPIEAFTGQLAVAIDNARWFARIGTVAAEEERGRIARDLHDRMGQSLAHVGFELDRAAKSGSEDELRAQVTQLRETVRGVVGELRETLYDLRTDVTAERDLGRALEEFLDRVRRRSSMDVAFRRRGSVRLPLPIERELWRVAQEAITNAERHARARSLVVVWITDEKEALLTITDDGVGMPPADTRRADAYGLVGMQERADAIGASLTFTSAPGEGTDVRVAVQR